MQPVAQEAQAEAARRCRCHRSTEMQKKSAVRTFVFYCANDLIFENIQKHPLILFVYIFQILLLFNMVQFIYFAFFSHLRLFYFYLAYGNYTNDYRI